MQALSSLCVFAMMTGCVADETLVEDPNEDSYVADLSDPCTAPIGRPPTTLHADPFYQKYLNAQGIPILSSAAVNNTALRRACQMVAVMLAARADVSRAMVARDARLAIIGRYELTTDIPEYRNLYSEYPGTDWNVRTRGLGGTLGRPVGATSEENLLCLSGDVYRGEDITVHEFAHTIYNVGIVPTESSFAVRLRKAFDVAGLLGTWKGTFAATNVDEYWAEGIQDWFDVNLERIPGDGLHNEINTRSELLARDAGLYQLASEIFPSTPVPPCPTKPI